MVLTMEELQLVLCTTHRAYTKEQKLACLVCTRRARRVLDLPPAERDMLTLLRTFNDDHGHANQVGSGRCRTCRAHVEAVLRLLRDKS